MEELHPKPHPSQGPQTHCSGWPLCPAPTWTDPVYTSTGSEPSLLLSPQTWDGCICPRWTLNPPSAEPTEFLWDRTPRSGEPLTLSGAPALEMQERQPLRYVPGSLPHPWSGEPSHPAFGPLTWSQSIPPTSIFLSPYASYFPYTLAAAQMESVMEHSSWFDLPPPPPPPAPFSPYQGTMEMAPPRGATFSLLNREQIRNGAHLASQRAGLRLSQPPQTPAMLDLQRDLSRSLAPPVIDPPPLTPPGFSPLASRSGTNRRTQSIPSAHCGGAAAGSDHWLAEGTALDLAPVGPAFTTRHQRSLQPDGDRTSLGSSRFLRDRSKVMKGHPAAVEREQSAAHSGSQGQGSTSAGGERGVAEADTQMRRTRRSRPRSPTLGLETPANTVDPLFIPQVPGGPGTLGGIAGCFSGQEDEEEEDEEDAGEEPWSPVFMEYLDELCRDAEFVSTVGSILDAEYLEAPELVGPQHGEGKEPPDARRLDREALCPAVSSSGGPVGEGEPEEGEPEEDEPEEGEPEEAPSPGTDTGPSGVCPENLDHLEWDDSVRQTTAPSANRYPFPSPLSLSGLRSLTPLVSPGRPGPTPPSPTAPGAGARDPRTTSTPPEQTGGHRPENQAQLQAFLEIGSPEDVTVLPPLDDSNGGEEKEEEEKKEEEEDASADQVALRPEDEALPAVGSEDVQEVGLPSPALLESRPAPTDSAGPFEWCAAAQPPPTVRPEDPDPQAPPPPPREQRATPLDGGENPSRVYSGALTRARRRSGWLADREKEAQEEDAHAGERGRRAPQGEPTEGRRLPLSSGAVSEGRTSLRDDGGQTKRENEGTNLSEEKMLEEDTRTSSPTKRRRSSGGRGGTTKGDEPLNSVTRQGLKRQTSNTCCTSRRCSPRWSLGLKTPSPSSSSCSSGRNVNTSLLLEDNELYASDGKERFVTQATVDVGSHKTPEKSPPERSSQLLSSGPRSRPPAKPAVTPGPVGPARGRTRPLPAEQGNPTPADHSALPEPRAQTPATTEWGSTARQRIEPAPSQQPPGSGRGPGSRGQKPSPPKTPRRQGEPPSGRRPIRAEGPGGPTLRTARRSGAGEEEGRRAAWRCLQVSGGGQELRWRATPWFPRRRYPTR